MTDGKSFEPRATVFPKEDRVATNCLPIPLSQRSGLIVSGPKNPTLPQLVAKFEPG
jgi:hypothetical protein